MELDTIDKQLLRMLQSDSKKTTKQYAVALGLSNTAVYERIKRLERQGIISHYVALLDKKKVDRNFVVYCQVRLNQHVKENVLQFEKEVIGLSEVVECYHLGGDYDYLLKIHVSDMESYREFMVTKLTAIKNIGSTQSAFVIKDVKHTTALPLS